MRTHRTSARNTAQLELSFTSSMAVKVIPQPNGDVLLKRDRIITEGTVRQAAKVLGIGYDLMLSLIRDREVEAWKPRTSAPNTKYRVNMSSVYALRERRRQAFQAA